MNLVSTTCLAPDHSGLEANVCRTASLGFALRAPQTLRCEVCGEHVALGRMENGYLSPERHRGGLLVHSNGGGEHLDPPTPHHTETKKAEANQAEGGGVGDLRDLKGIIELRETVSKRMLHVTVPTMNIMGVSRTTMAGMKMSLTMHSENGRSSATHEERQTAAATKTTTARPIKQNLPIFARISLKRRDRADTGDDNTRPHSLCPQLDFLLLTMWPSGAGSIAQL